MEPIYNPKLQDEMAERIARVICAGNGEFAENWKAYLMTANDVLYSLAIAKAEIGGIKFLAVKRDASGQCFAYPPDESR